MEHSIGNELRKLFGKFLRMNLCVNAMIQWTDYPVTVKVQSELSNIIDHNQICKLTAGARWPSVNHAIDVKYYAIIATKYRHLSTKLNTGT